MGWKEAIWRGGGSDGAAADDVAPDGALDTEAPDLAAAPFVAGSAPSSATPSAILTADFATIYVQTNSVGNPAVDNILTAFAELADADDNSRKLAMGAVVKATGVIPTEVVATLASRDAALTMAVRVETEGASKRQAVRAGGLKGLEDDTAQRVAELKAEIAKLESTRDAKVAEVKRANDEDAKALEAFKARVAPEAARLSALRQFLATLAKPAASKK